MRDPWKRRLQRAEQLTLRYPEARELLDFYVAVLAFQRDCALTADAPSSEEEVLAQAVRDLPALLVLVSTAAPPALASRADVLASEGEESWIELLHGYWKGEGAATSDEGRRFFAKALLQPHGARLASPRSGGPVTRCPACDGLPQVAALTQQGDGAALALICARCLGSWRHPRLQCVACSEARPERLSYHVAEQYPHVRVHTCRSCETYLKCVDLTRDGLAAPLVDDVASLPLDLWARDRGLFKREPNLLGF